MKKPGILGLMAMTLAGIMNAGFNFKITGNPKPNKPTAKNKPSEGSWRYSQPSPYFGQRSKIISADTPKGIKLMKLKTALKHGYEFS